MPSVNKAMDSVLGTAYLVMKGRPSVSQPMPGPGPGRELVSEGLPSDQGKTLSVLLTRILASLPPVSPSVLSWPMSTQILYTK